MVLKRCELMYLKNVTQCAMLCCTLSFLSWTGLRKEVTSLLKVAGAQSSAWRSEVGLLVQSCWCKEVSQEVCEQFHSTSAPLCSSHCRRETSDA